jgi:hypothetical protein
VGSQPPNGLTIVAAMFAQSQSKNLFVQRCQTQQILQIIQLALPQTTPQQKLRDETKKRRRKITKGKFIHNTRRT